MADLIYNNFSLMREIKSEPKDVEVNDDFKAEVEEHLEKARGMEQEDNYHFVSVDIIAREAVAKIEYAQNQGLKVEGIVPTLVKTKEVKDILIMRKRPRQTGYDKIDVRVGENKKLFQLVK